MFKKYIYLFLVVVFGLYAGCSSPSADVLKADKLARASGEAYQSAVRLYQKAFKAERNSKKRDALALKLGTICFKVGDYAQAILYLEPLKTKEAGMVLAQSLFKNSDFTGALEIFNNIGLKGDAAYLYAYGLTLEKNNLYDQALRLYALVKGDASLQVKAQERIAAINLLSGGALDESTKALIQKSPGLEAYPQASAIYLLTDENITLQSDNHLVTDFHYCIKILNDRGKEKFGEVSIPYDSTYEKLELTYARTIKPDGTVVTVGDKNIRDVSLYLNFPMYSNARVKIVSMPEVAVGSVIEYKGRIATSELPGPGKEDFGTPYWLAADEPIIHEKCVIRIPKNKMMRYKLMNSAYNTHGYDMTPKMSEEKNDKIYSLSFDHVPQIIPEPGMPPVARVNPYVLFSTFKSWQDIFDWWQKFYQDKLAVDLDMKSKVALLVKGKKTQEEKIRAIYNFCAQDIRYVAVEYGQAGYEPHKATEIFKNKYGDCKDKAILLISMLSVAGIEAYPVLISTADSYSVEEDMPSLMFNHAIAATKLKGKLIFMDATASTASFGDLPSGDEDQRVLVFYKDHYELIKTPQSMPEDNKVSTRMDIKVNKDESVQVWRRVDSRGQFGQGQRYWLKFTMPILIEETLKQKAMAIAENAVLKKYEVKNADDLDKPVSLEYTFTAPRYFVKAGKDRIIHQLSDVNDGLVVKETRMYPIDFSSFYSSEETIEVELPQHLAVRYIPAPVEVANKWFTFISRYSHKDKRKLTFYAMQKRNEKIVNVAEYDAYKKIIQDLVSKLNQQVILEETKR
jgi:tetratricopeptide (TPR) repeat protein